MTNQGLHIKFRVLFNKINTNKNKNFLPQEIDLILNDALIQCVTTILNAESNVRKQGYSDSQYRLDLIQDHIEYNSTNTAEEGTLELSEFPNGKKVKLILADYYKLLGSTSTSANECHTYLKKDNRLLKTGRELNIALNDYFLKSGIDSPVSELRGNVLYVYEDNFTIQNIEISYLKKLPVIQFDSTDVLPFTDSFWKLVVEIAVNKAYGVATGEYQILHNEIIKAE